MTAPTSSRWIKLSFLASFLAIGLPYWLTAYGRLSYESLFTPGLTLPFMAALLLPLKRTDSFWRTVRWLGSVTLTVVMARVLVDGLRDPSSHNLWPFEAVISFAIGVAVTLPGAFLGSGIGWLRGRPFWK